MKQVLFFNELEKDQQPMAGGKGGTLARLYQAGFTVPDGFVVLPSAFAGDELTQAGWEQVQTSLARARNGAGTQFAVRSSALSEDSAQASFGGQFDTVLEVETDDKIRQAIHTVRRSRHNERVQAYSKAKQMGFEHEVAVVVQKLIHADISGILFTADPVTGSRMTMSGNFIYGLGEALVSGDVEPETFSLSQPKGRYQGPAVLKRFARKLFKLGQQLQKELGSPQDIEWAIAGSKLYLLQSRPITTLIGYDPATGLWNSSYTGDYLWIGHEVFPDVMTPSTWSIFQEFQQFNVGGMSGIGNIGGRLYMNVSLMHALMRTFGYNEERFAEYIELSAMPIPEGINVPGVSMTRFDLIKAMLPVMWELLPLQMKLRKQSEAIFAKTPQQCQALLQKIQQTTDRPRLKAIWKDEAHPLFKKLLQLQDALNEDYFNPFMAVQKSLTKLVGVDEANAILATVSGGTGELASMGPIVGVAKLARGEMNRDEFTQIAGHRCLMENELAASRPYEDANWIDKRLAEFAESPVDVEGMIAKRSAEFDARWKKFAARYPKQAMKLRKKFEQITLAMGQREQIRSELTRLLGVLRAWFLKVGEITGLGDGIFYLSYQETMRLLDGEDVMAETIPARREMYKKLRELPAYPMVINGRFDPFQWAADPNRRYDIYDANAPVVNLDSDRIEGYPGSAGRVEGIVRFLASPDDAEQLNKGEILLAATTNVGWTPIFPRAAAVITDIGAPLSHAAIVARELGIPAVVGCHHATRQLKTGDRVLVDGSRGVVEILETS